jgi:hypothetical protein
VALLNIYILYHTLFLSLSHTHCCAGESGRVFAGYELNYRELIASKLSATSNMAPWSTERNLKFAKLLQFILSKYIKSALSVTR